LEWTEPDEDRPLTKRGFREADAIAARLASEPPGRLVSSPYLRCVQTLEPLATALGAPIGTTEALAEGASGDEALELLLVIAQAETVACCTHGDVVLAIVHTLGLAPTNVRVASTWELTVEDGHVAEARFVEQPPR
jgi:8-oxo-dGTP diphosphatase